MKMCMLAMKMCMLAMRRYIGNVSYRDCEKDSRCCSQDTNVAWSCGASERVAATVFPPGFTNFARLKIWRAGWSKGSQQRCSQQGSPILLGRRLRPRVAATMFPTGFINFAWHKIKMDGASDDETRPTSPIMAGRNVRPCLTRNMTNRE